MLKHLIKLRNDTDGATAVEYAIIASVISVVSFGAFIALGEQSNENMTEVADRYAEAQSQ